MDEVEWALDTVLSSNEEVILSVNKQTWKSLDFEALSHQSDPLQWAENVRVYHPRCLPPMAAVYYINEPDAYEILAVKVPNSGDTETSNIMAIDALTEFEHELIPQHQQNQVTTSTAKSSLFSLLNVLLTTTTAEQSAQITHAVFSFLQSEITLPRLYSQLTSIVGYSAIRRIVNSLENKDQEPEALRPKPVTQLSRFKAEHTSRYPAPTYLFASAEEQKTFFQSMRISNNVKNNSLTHTDPWHIDMPPTSTIGYRVGCTATTAGDHILLSGGILDVDNTNNGWSTITIINQSSWRSVDHELTGPLPHAPFGNSCVVVNAAQDSLFVFGGALSLSVLTDAIVSHGRQIQPCQMSADLKVLDLNTLQWSNVLCSEVSPSPRCYAAMIPVIHPADNESYELIGACLIGGLGKPDRPMAMEDCWFLNLQESESWRPMSITNFEPFWGATVVPAGLNRWLICGGYGAPDGIRYLMITTDGGRPKAHLTLLSGGIDPTCGRRCFAHGVLMKAEGAEFTPVEIGMTRLNRTSSTARNFLFLLGGVCESEQQLWSMSIFEIFSSDEADITGAKYVKTVYPQNRPCCPFKQNPNPRVGEAGVFIMHQTPLSNQRMLPNLPIFFISGGFSVTSTKSAVPIPSDFTSSQLITLHSIDPLDNGDHVNRLTNVGSEVDGKVEELQTVDVHVDDLQTHSLVDKRGVNHEEVRSMFKVMDEQLRHYPPWLSSLTYTPSLLSSLGSNIPWPFTVLGHLLENSCHPTTRSMNVAIEVGLSKSSGQFFLAITDDGRGMGYAALQKLLKRFGVRSDRANNSDHQRLHRSVEYGLGFKLAASRLSQSCLVISRTSKCLGVGLVSQRFLHDIEALTNAAVPACFWKLPQRDTIISQQEHLLNQQKIFKYSPFKKVHSLAEQINLLGLKTGTRMVFFENFNAWPQTLAVDTGDGLLRIGCNVSNGTCNSRITGASRLSGENITEWIQDASQGELASLDMKIPYMANAELNFDDEKSIAPYSAEIFKECPVSGESYIVTRSSLAEFTPHAGFSSIYNTDQPIVYPGNLKSSDSNADAMTDTEPQNTFPFWTDAKYSIDTCLSTYMYWALLFNTSKLRCCGWDLMPAPEESRKNKNTTRTDPFENSLYRLLKRRLNGLVELDWLFSPDDSSHETFGLLGFVNDLEDLVAEGSKLKYHETGILLYYKERLVRRLFVPFPASVEMLNDFATRPCKLLKKTSFFSDPQQHFEDIQICADVPEWLYPNMNKDDFVVNRSPIFEEFIRRVKRLVTDYLSVCLDDARRQSWIDERGRQFLEEAGRRRPLSPLLHAALLKKPSVAS